MRFFENANCGRVNGAAGIIVGILLIALNAGTVFYNSTFYPKLLFVGIFIAVFGVGLVIFPGGSIRKGDVPEGTSHLKFLWANAPRLHRAMWILFALAGAAAGGAAVFFLEQ